MANGSWKYLYSIQDVNQKPKVEMTLCCMPIFSVDGFYDDPQSRQSAFQ